MIKSLKENQVTPTGYHVLVELMKFEEKTEGGILLSSSEVTREQKAMPIGKVLKFGPLCFKNHESGCNSPEEWGVKVGDYIQFPSHVYMKVAGEKDNNLVLVLDYDIKAKVEINE